MADCPNRQRNLKDCTCTYTACGKRGMCCECVAQHRAAGEIPGCFFTAAGEASYDRSVRSFIRDQSQGTRR
ncbi:MAG TPA: DUF6485 family protein [Phycisphaerae bacterium]|nr:hypothetical protein [Phycisphaerae bacterium]HOI55254.1 DUF6485 family protein [Phycisphaerae bacterium]